MPVVLLRFQFVSEIMQGRAPEVYYHLLNWKVTI
jgi:hypothetical protein